MPGGKPVIFLFALFWTPLMVSSAQQLYMQHYPANVYKGATQNWEVVQDEKGIFYFANNDGLLSYDGMNWDMAPMPNKEFVFSVAIAQDGRKYVASYNELGYFKPDSAGSNSYVSITQKLPKQYQNFKYVNEIAVHGDTVCFVDRDHVYIFLNDTFKVLNESGRFLKFRDQLFLTRKDGFHQYKNFAFQPAPLNADLDSITCRWVGEIAKDRLLVLDDNFILYEVDINQPEGQRLKLRTQHLAEYLKGLGRFRLAILDNGNLACLSQKELAIFDKDLTKAYSIASDSQSETFTTRMLYEDTKHNLWLTTNASIVQVITSSPLGYYDRSSGLNGVVLSLGKLNDKCFVGTTTGIYQKDKAGFVLLPGTEGETWNFYNINDKLYAAHGTGVFEVDQRGARKIAEHKYVHSLCALQGSGDLVIGTYNSGLWLLHKQRSGWVKKKIEGFDEETRFIVEDKEGHLWISHYNKGIYQLRLNDARDSVSHVTFYDSDDGLPSNLNNRLHQRRDGRMVVMTIKGIYIFDKARDKFLADPSINTALEDNLCIYAMDEGDDGSIFFWGGTENKMELAGRLHRQKEVGYKMECTPFYKASIAIRGLRVDVDAPVLWVSPSEVWIGHNVKLITYNPLQQTFYEDSFRTYLKTVVAGDQPVVGESAKLEYSNNSIRFQFMGGFYESPEKNEFQYKLAGFQDQWSDWSATNEAVFTNLPDGDFDFSVRSRNLYGIVGEPAVFHLSIAAPWYKTWWAYLLYFFAAFLFVGITVQLNTKRIRDQKMKLERKVRKKTKKLRARNKEIIEKGKKIEKQAKELEALNLTKDKLFSIVSHDLRGPVKQIQVVLSLVESGHITEDELKQFLPKFKETIEHTVNLTDNLLFWANSQRDGIEVKPSVFNIASVAAEHEKLFKPMALEKGIQLENHITDDMEVLADKDMIKLVIRNLLNNALKFTDKGGKISLHAVPNHKGVIVSVLDTGIGMSETQIESLFSKQHMSRQGTFGEKGTGLGLMLCHEFVERNNGTITVESTPGKGTKFSFTVPLAMTADQKM